jgi:hypothetical protein
MYCKKYIKNPQRPDVRPPRNFLGGKKESILNSNIQLTIERNSLSGKF